MPRKIVYSTPARHDVQDITSFGLREFGPTATAVYLDDLEGAIQSIARFPGIGRRHDGLGVDLRVLVSRAPVVAYVKAEQQVRIVRILPAKRDWMALLRDLPDKPLN